MPAFQQSPSRASANMIGIAAMIGSSAAFVANDTCVKLLSDQSMPLGQIITLRNAAAVALLVIYGLFAGAMKLPDHSAAKPLAWRMIGDVGGTLFFLGGLMLMPIAEATAIGQLTPLALTATAAFLFAEPVGLRRWLATIVGFFGVLLICRPGADAFTPAALLILASVAFVVMRDLATRRTAERVSGVLIAATSVAGTLVAGLAMGAIETWIAPTSLQWAYALTSGAALALAHMLVIKAMRTGDVAAVGPFRYALIAFALLSGYVVWRQWPDAIQLLGIAVLTAAGAYTVRHERRAAITPPPS